MRTIDLIGQASTTSDGRRELTSLFSGYFRSSLPPTISSNIVAIQYRRTSVPHAITGIEGEYRWRKSDNNNIAIHHSVCIHMHNSFMMPKRKTRGNYCQLPCCTSFPPHGHGTSLLSSFSSSLSSSSSSSSSSTSSTSFLSSTIHIHRYVRRRTFPLAPFPPCPLSDFMIWPCVHPCPSYSCHTDTAKGGGREGGPGGFPYTLFLGRRRPESPALFRGTNENPEVKKKKKIKFQSACPCPALTCCFSRGRDAEIIKEEEGKKRGQGELYPSCVVETETREMPRRCRCE